MSEISLKPGELLDVADKKRIYIVHKGKIQKFVINENCEFNTFTENFGQVYRKEILTQEIE
jgi:hypothetical protein